MRHRDRESEKKNLEIEHTQKRSNSKVHPEMMKIIIEVDTFASWPF